MTSFYMKCNFGLTWLSINVNVPESKSRISPNICKSSVKERQIDVLTKFNIACYSFTIASDRRYILTFEVCHHKNLLNCS